MSCQSTLTLERQDRERLSAEFVGYQITFNFGAPGHILDLLTKRGPLEDLIVSEETLLMHRSVRPVKDPLYIGDVRRSR
jgi:hypothetical protein